MRQGLGRYMFFCDLEGALTDPRVAEAIGELRTKAGVGADPRLLSGLPRARTPRRSHLPLQSPGTMARVLVLNATYEPINVCTLRRAAVLLLKEKAELLEQREGAALHSEHMTLERPDVIRLVNYVRIPREAHRRKITRRAVLARDSWTCQYCGSTKSGLTVDHVIPRSRGGKSVWENIVAACATCNRRKGNRLPREIHMHPKKTPKAPGRRSSSRWPARRFRALGSSTCRRPRRGEAPRRAIRSEPPRRRPASALSVKRIASALACSAHSQHRRPWRRWQSLMAVRRGLWPLEAAEGWDGPVAGMAGGPPLSLPRHRGADPSAPQAPSKSAPSEARCLGVAAVFTRHARPHPPRQARPVHPLRHLGGDRHVVAAGTRPPGRRR